MAFKRTKLTNVASKAITPTAEQLYNMELVRSGKDVKIVAGAGTGKSSSLRYIASSIPEKNFLVLCFNAANAVESNEHPDRPENIFYSTIHSVAYKAVVDFKFKKKLGGYLDYKDLPESVEHCLTALPEKDQYKALVTVQKAMLECITYFCRSDSESILDFIENKLRYEFTFTEKRPNLLGELELSNDAIKKLTLLTGSYWHSLINSDSASKISHDVYLKMFQLSKEPIDEVWDKQSKRYVHVDVVCLDECLTRKQTVKTDKGLMRIQRLYSMWANREPLPNILSYNIEQGLYEYKPMLGALQSLERETLLVKTEGLNKIECTPNHRILTQRGYVPAAELLIGNDYLLVDNPENQKAKLLLNEDQLQIVIGSFLGDGYLERRSKFNTFRLKLTHGVAQLEYLAMKAEAFQVYKLGNGVSGYTGIKDIYTAQTRTFILNKDIWACVEDMDARALAIWYMDDGYINKGNCITLSSNSFTFEEHNKLLEILKTNFDLTASIGKDREFYTLRFNVVNSRRLLEITRNYMHSNLGYKNQLSTTTYAYTWDDAFKPFGGNFVSSIDSIGKHTVYDIEVADNHNFVTTRTIDNHSNSSGIIVHNCQDTNPVSENILRNQTKQRVVIGDPMQQLYAWRQATDILSLPYYASFSTGQLTESFRFNSTIADKANLILRKSGSSMQLIGGGSKTSVETKAHLCRTNASVVGLMLNYIGTSEKIYTSIALKGTFSKLYHMQACFFNEKPMYPSKELSSITDKKSLLLAMEYSEDLRRLDKLRQSFVAKGGSITSVKKELDKLVVETPEEATLVISTIHASKGMEYCSVTIDDDFLTIPEGVSTGEVIDAFWETDSLVCLLYVGVTRAKVQVQLPGYFYFI